MIELHYPFKKMTQMFGDEQSRKCTCRVRYLWQLRNDDDDGNEEICMYNDGQTIISALFACPAFALLILIFYICLAFSDNHQRGKIIEIKHQTELK